MDFEVFGTLMHALAGGGFNRAARALSTAQEDGAVVIRWSGGPHANEVIDMLAADAEPGDLVVLDRTEFMYRGLPVQLRPA